MFNKTNDANQLWAKEAMKSVELLSHFGGFRLNYGEPHGGVEGNSCSELRHMYSWMLKSAQGLWFPQVVLSKSIKKVIFPFSARG